MQSEVEKLVARLRHLVSLNEPWNGGPYQGVAATACVEAMDEAASLIERLYREREKLREAADYLIDRLHAVAQQKVVRDLDEAQERYLRVRVLAEQPQ